MHHLTPQRSRDAPRPIAFQPPRNQSPAGTNNRQSWHNESLAPDTLSWYYSLTNKNVQSLHLHKGDFYFVVLSMQDGSLFKLELSQSNVSAHPGAIGVASRVPDRDAADLVATRWITIELVGDLPITDVKFVLSICYGAFKQIHLLQHGKKMLFAFSFAASVARQCIRFEDNLTDSTGTSLDHFWRQVHLSPQVISQSLWEENIADEGRDKVRKWLFQAARESIDTIVFKPSAGPSAKSKTDETEKYYQQSSTASIVAWLEFSVSNQAASSLATWDAEWNTTWRKRWRKNWEGSWKGASDLPEIALIQLGKIANLNKILSNNLTSATRSHWRLSGRIAGSMSIEVGLAATAAKIPPKSYLEWEISSARKEVNTKGKIQLQCITQCSSLISSLRRTSQGG